MVYVKFTRVKLIINSISLVCLILLFSSEIGLAKEKYAVQIAAIKTQENPSGIAKKDVVTDSLFVDSIQQKPEIKENNSLVVSSQRKDKSNAQGIGNYILYLFFNKSEFSALKNSLIDYGNNYIPRELRGLWLTIITASFQFPIILVFLVIILFFILNIISVFLILNYSVKKKNNKDRFLRIYGKMYEGVLLSYLFKEINWESASLKLKRKDKRENRKLLISILLNFHENLKGEVDKFIPEIFTKLGLQKDSLKSANSLFNYRKVKGIRELTYLYSEGALGIISNLINDKNDNVRAEAQTAFIMLNPDDPFKFFQTLTKPFTRWTQLSAFNLLRLHQLPIPAFTDFLYSKHPNIRNFSLRMIVYYQQLENISEIFKMLDHEMELTRFLAYRAINDLRLYDGKELIKNKYWIETGKNKLEIIKALRNIGEVEDLDFLKVVIESDMISFKIEACRTMYFMNSESQEQLMILKDEANKELELFIAHVTDPRN